MLKIAFLNQSIIRLIHGINPLVAKILVVEFRPNFSTEETAKYLEITFLLNNVPIRSKLINITRACPLV